MLVSASPQGMRVSKATLCPLGQPKKAIGHEPLIGPWLATLRPSRLSVSGTDSAHHDCRITLRAGTQWHLAQREANRNCTSKQGAGCRDTCSHVGLREKYFFLTSLFIGHSDKPGGLNGSTQHLLKVHVRESMKLNSFKGINANGTLPCLGPDRVQPYRWVP